MAIYRKWALRTWLFCFSSFCLTCLTADPLTPPAQVLKVDLGAAGASDLKESNRTVTRQSDSMASFSFIERRPLNDGPFYISGGVRGESFTMDNTQDFPIQQLQDYGGEFSIEYFKGSTRAAYLTLRPGFYFETHPTLASWDVPIEFATGIPITPDLNGVAGISYARFLHHPVPIAGLSWIISPQWRIDAIYPNPTVAYKINQALEAQLTGELLGAGFRTDPDPGRAVVEYYVYRVGGNLAWQVQPGFKITGGAGMEYERVFDLWRAGRSLQATNSPYIRLGMEWAR